LGQSTPQRVNELSRERILMWGSKGGGGGFGAKKKEKANKEKVKTKKRRLSRSGGATKGQKKGKDLKRGEKLTKGIKKSHLEKSST